MISRVVLSLSLFSIATLFGQKPTPPIPELRDAQWTSLFDGEKLDGWSIKGGTGKFEVVEGCIHGFGQDVKSNTFLCTEKTYSDFILSFEVKFGHLKGNSGMMFRATQKPAEDENGRVFGYQCEHDNRKTRAWTAGIFDEARRGWLMPSKDKAHKDRQEWFTSVGRATFDWTGWNTIIIRCKGNHIQTWLNGVKRADFIDIDPQNDTREGFFGLQVHSGKNCEVYWREIKIIELK